MDAGSAVKAFVVCQPKKVLISPKRGEIPRLYCLLSRHPNGRKRNQGRM